MPEVKGGASDVKAGGAYVEIGGKTGKLDTALSMARKKLKNFGASVTKLGTSFTKLGGVMMLPLAGGVKIAADFGEQMASVSTMIEQSDVGKFMPGFSADIRRMSVEFGEGTDTIAKGLYDILSASIAPAKAIGVLRASMMAAKAGMTDTGTAADAITTIINSYGLAADQANSVSDLLFATVKRGKTTFAELAPAVGMVASTASVAGLAMEEMAAALATGTRNGVRTRISVTALNSTLMTFLKPTTKAAAAAKKFGFELNTNTLRTIGLVGVIKKMQGATAEQIASVFENRRALKLIMPVIQDLEGFTVDLALAQKRGGLTQEAYGKMAGILMHTIRKLKQSIVDLLRSIGISLEKRTEAWMESIIGLVDAIKLWIKQNPQLLTSYANLAVRLVALGLSLAVIGKGIGFVAKLLSPGGLFAVGIGSILYFSGLLDDNTKKWLDWVGKIEMGTTTVGELFGNMKKLWRDLKPEWESGMEVLRSAWDEFLAAMKVGWLKVSRTLLEGIISTLETISKSLYEKAEELAPKESILEALTGDVTGGEGIISIIGAKFAAKKVEEYGVAATEAASIASDAYSKMRDKIVDAESTLEAATKRRTDAMKGFEKQAEMGKQKVKEFIAETVKAVITPPAEPEIESAAERYGAALAAELEKGGRSVEEKLAEMKYGLEEAIALGFIEPREITVKGKTGEEKKAIAAAVPTGEIIGTFQGAIATLVAGGPRRVLEDQLDVMKGIEDNTKITADNIEGALGLA